jgi:hypothetical protein
MSGRWSGREGPSRRWGWRRAALAIALPALLGACGTPQEVKDLSAAQIAYFDAAVQAVRIESEALVFAATKIKEDAERRIEATRTSTLGDFENLAAGGFAKVPADRRDETAKKMVSDIAEIEQTAAESKASLAADLEAIRLKTEELTGYIEKMKQVQVVLDVYLQSEKVGESVSSSLLGRDSVQNALGTVNALLPRVADTANELKTLIGNLASTGG